MDFKYIYRERNSLADVLAKDGANVLVGSLLNIGPLIALKLLCSFNEDMDFCFTVDNVCEDVFGHDR